VTTEKRKRGERQGHAFAAVMAQAIKVHAFVKARMDADPKKYGARERAVIAATKELNIARSVVDRALRAATSDKYLRITSNPILLTAFASAKRVHRKSTSRK
jgi:hypothetical protein